MFKRASYSIGCMLAIALGTGAVVAQVPLGSSFTYQGQLKNASGLVNNPALEMSLTLYDAPTAGIPIAGPVNFSAAVLDGMFTIQPDFGSAAFNGQERWLEIAVDGVTLSPRQHISATPYALQTRGLSVDAAGNLGVGTQTPGARLHIGGTPGTDGLMFPDGTVQTTAATNTPDAWSVNAGNVYRNAGDVGIGTADPIARLTVLGNDDTNGTAWFQSPKGPFNSHIHYGTTGDWYLRSADGAGKVILQDTGGNVGIRTSEPQAALDVNGDAIIRGFVLDFRGGDFKMATPSRGDGGRALVHEGDGTSERLVVNFANDFNDGVRIEGKTFVNGDLGIGTSTPAATLHIAGTPGVDGIMFPDGSLQTTAASGGAWNLTGNTGVGGGFIGTTDDQPFVIKANNHRVMRYQFIETSARTVNVLGGSEVNSIAGGVVGATIAGGGSDSFSGNDFPNSVQADFGTVSGGHSNWTRAVGATVSGGTGNTAGSFLTGVGRFAAVGGGDSNEARGSYSAVGGGSVNLAQSDFGTVAGGGGNTAMSYGSTVAGGITNRAGTNSWSDAATVGGGFHNIADRHYSTVAGGNENLASGAYSTVGGGDHNNAYGDNATVSGGMRNSAISYGSTVVGGIDNTAGINTLSTGDCAVVAGGRMNSASTLNAAVLGGTLNIAQGINSVVAGGTQNQTTASNCFVAGTFARAFQSGSFVWADSSSSSPFATTNPNQFLVRSSGGVGINTNDPAGFALKVAGTVSCTSLTQTSDARCKQSVGTLDDALVNILKLRGVSYDWIRNDDQREAVPDGRQIGFIAQEVEQVLPELVSTDTNGFKSVAYANVVPVLVEAIKAQQEQINQLMVQNAELSERLNRIEVRIRQ